MDSNLSGSGKADNGNVVEFPRAVGIAKSELHVVIGNAVLRHARAG
jgi:hypothetical protein